MSENERFIFYLNITLLFFHDKSCPLMNASFSASDKVHLRASAPELQCDRHIPSIPPLEGRFDIVLCIEIELRIAFCTI